MSVRTMLYIQPMLWVLLEVTAGFCLWTVLMTFMKNAVLKKGVAILALLAAVFLAVDFTLIRKPHLEAQIVLMPFYSFREAAENPEKYREMFMNIVLLLPFGMAFPYVLPDRVNKARRLFLTVLSGVVLSVLIESAQYAFLLGRCETDDVLCNALGAALGGLSYRLSWFYKNRTEKTQSLP